MNSFDNSYILRMDYGKERRAEILKHVAWRISQERPGLPVNGEHQMNIEKDKDLQYLIKKGKLKRFRGRRTHSWFGRIFRQTYLTLGDNI